MGSMALRICHAADEQKVEVTAHGCDKRKQDPLQVAQPGGRLLGTTPIAAGWSKPDLHPLFDLYLFTATKKGVTFRRAHIVGR
jgi:hypothetical protein